ncbi:MAG: glycosyltransferase [Patescibacteria group bacterium]
MRVTIALPVLNEELVLNQSVERLLRFVRESLPEAECTVVIADNGSTDQTEEIGRRFADTQVEVRYLRLAERGKGRAVFAAWRLVPADVYAFMDIDLSTDLVSLPELCDTVAETGGMAIGSRFHPDSVVVRSLARRVISQGYRSVLKRSFGTTVSDAPCGFKAISAAVFTAVVPEVEDQRWFFDTELVLRAEHAGFSVHEIPVTWRELTTAGRRSRVNVPRLAWEYLKQVRRLKRQLR